MMVGVDLIPWRCMAPADRLVSDPVESVFAHCAEDTGFATIKNEENCDRNANNCPHGNKMTRGERFQSACF